MSIAFATIALIGKFRSHDIGATLSALGSFLRDRGRTVLIEYATAEATGTHGFEVASYEVICARADLAIIVGGDGTLLHAARLLAEYDVPLVGVNQGRLGFMTDISRHTMLDRIGQMLDGEYRLERRSLLEAMVVSGNRPAFMTLAMNDVVVNKGELGRMIEFQLRIDGEFIYDQRSDGLIIATPTGSTAYAMSAGGPILHPALSGIAIVPLCPHALSNRPITVSDRSAIEIELIPPHDARVHCDGQMRFDARAGDTVRVTRSEHAVTLVHPPGYSYFAMLREKLHWSEAPRNH
ncbi:MAG: NAD kinase [Rhodocyclaceae bacterium]|jgi:NAD+ kinase